MKKLNPYANGFTVLEVSLVIVVVFLIVLTSFILYSHKHNKSIPLTTGSATSNCSNVSQYSNAQATDFVNAYKDGKQQTLSILIECGTPSNAGYVTNYNLTTSNQVIEDSQYSYGDASPPGPTTKYTCSLSKISANSATADCNNTFFNIFVN